MKKKIPNKKEALKWIEKHFPYEIDNYNEYIEESKKKLLSFKYFVKINDKYGEYEKWRKEFKEYLLKPLHVESLEQYFLLNECLHSLISKWKQHKRFKDPYHRNIRAFLIALSKGKISGWHTDRGVLLIERYDTRQKLAKSKSFYDWLNWEYSYINMKVKYDFHKSAIEDTKLDLFEWLIKRDKRYNENHNIQTSPYQKVKCGICKKEDIAYNMETQYFESYTCKKCVNNEKELTAEEITEYINSGIGTIHFEPVKNGRFNQQLIIDLVDGGCLTFYPQHRNEASTVVKYIAQEHIPAKWQRGKSKSSSNNRLGLALIASKCRY